MMKRSFLGNHSCNSVLEPSTQQISSIISCISKQGVLLPLNLYLLHLICLSHTHAQKKTYHFSSILLVQITSIMQMLNSLSFKLFSFGLGQWGYWWLHPGDLSISFPLSLFVFWFCAAASQTAENTQHKHNRPFNLPVVISPPLTYIALQAGCFMKNI